MNNYAYSLSRATKSLYRGTQVVWYLFYIVEVILLFRFALKLVGANSAASFTIFIYSISYPFITPFLFVLPSPQIAGRIIEWTTLLALFVYWVLAWGVVHFLVMGKPVSRREAEKKLRRQDFK